MELTLENLKKFKQFKANTSAVKSEIGKEMLALLKEELLYLEKWKELNTDKRHEMIERADFIKMTIKKAEKYS